MTMLLSESAFFGGPDGSRASKRHVPGLLQIRKAPQIIGGGFPVQMQRGTRQADRTQHFVAHLRQTGKNLLHTRTDFGDTFVAPLLCFRDRLILAALALNMPAPALPL